MKKFKIFLTSNEMRVDDLEENEELNEFYDQILGKPPVLVYTGLIEHLIYEFEFSENDSDSDHDNYDWDEYNAKRKRKEVVKDLMWIGKNNKPITTKDIKDFKKNFYYLFEEVTAHGRSYFFEGYGEPDEYENVFSFNWGS